ncbi:uncharacterized protein LOC113765539 [Coffea eugenioides]|uniref:uncharacterized protein LOC113765539 n=1 Tax=Coffea eugenioides TaxID=49369 RepID=UPI000F60A998|nr:uncharacterized protein LOC113765539 [Coffea eugenioides]
MVWGGGSPKMEAELEEGEAYDDDTSIDPEIAFSYLDEKVQSVLGHFQKYFEGGVSAENLGAKFGGYGSFLPTYQRSPSIWSQPKSPQRVQIHTTTKSPMCREVAVQNATALPDPPLSQRNGTAASRGVHLSHEKVVQSGDGSRQDSCLSSVQVTEKFPTRHQPSTNKSLNPSDQKPLKFRIKVPQKNAAIYSGLGLTSPSSSTGNSPGGSGGNLLESQETPDESSSCILKMLTSLTIAGGLLLSPLHNTFINLISNIPMESNKPEATIKLKHDHSTTSVDDSTSRLSNEVLLTRKQSKAVGKSKKYNESRCRNQMAFEDHMLSRLKENPGAEVPQSKDSFKDSAKALEAFGEHENGATLKKRKDTKDKAKGRLSVTELVKDESFGSMSGLSDSKIEHQEDKSCSLDWTTKNHVKSSQKDVPVDKLEGIGNKANQVPASFKADSDTSQSERDTKGDIDHLIQKVSARTTHEEDQSRMPVSAKKFSSESKKKLKGAQVRGKQFVDSAEESTRAGISAVARQKATKRDANKVRDTYKDLFETNSARVDVLENSSVNRLKDSNVETLKEKQPYGDRPKGKPSGSKFDDQVISETLLNDPAIDSLPINNGPTLVTEQATMALIEENWVQCDQCQAWRLLPYGTKPENLPEKWLCSMLNWLPGMNHCDISEEETTKALYASYQLPVLENQHWIQNHADRPATGAHAVDEQLLNQSHQNVGFDYKASGRKKAHKIKETSFTGSKGKNFGQDLVKRGSSKDMKQSSLGVKPVNRSITVSEIAVEKHSNRQKQKHVTGGDVKLKKKSKRETDRHELEPSKKSKTASAVKNIQASAACLGRSGIKSKTILPTLASTENRNPSERDYPKEEERNGLQTSLRKPSERASGLLGNGYLDMMGKSNSGEISLKKRKLKDWQSSQNNAETLQNDGSQLPDRNLPAKEESSDSGFRRDKKLRVSQIDGKESSRSKSSAELKRKDMNTRMVPSACNNTIDRNFDKPKQLNKCRVKITSQLTMEDLESLKKDLGCEPVLTAATSSSSKVSDSRKKRNSYQGVNGSPVESVSSSPMRMSSLNKLSPEKLDGFELDDVKVGGFPIKGSPRKAVDGDVNNVTKRSGIAKKRKNPDVLNPELAENHMLDFRKTDAGGKLGEECELGGRPPSLFGNVYLDNDHLDILESHSTYLTDRHASEPFSVKDRIGKDQHNTVLPQKKSGKASSLLPKHKGRNFGLDSEDAVENVSDLPNDRGDLNPKTSSSVDTGIDQNHVAADGVLLGDVKQPFVDQSGVQSVKSNKSISKRESRKLLDGSLENLLQPKGHRRSGVNLGDPCSKDANNLIQQDLIKGSDALRSNSALKARSDAKSLIDHHPEDEHEVLPFASKPAPGTQNGSLLQVPGHDVSIRTYASEVSKDHRNIIHHNEPHQAMGSTASGRSVAWDLSGPSLERKDAARLTAPLDVLKEAEGLRNDADNIKDSGFSFECNELYFQAALKFLHAASLLESNFENSKPGEMNQMQIYGSAAKLCETCAHEYERQQEMAAAALAYKCMEVANMRVVYCKNTSTNRLCRDLQASLQIVPQGESPSSSASDIDNLNNQALVEKASLAKSNGSHSGNHVIAPRNRPGFFRLLDFAKDVNSAMEATRKSQNAFSAANVILEESQNKEGIAAVKRVIDFSFQDVEELLHLVQIAIRAISRQGFIRSRD